MNMRLITSLVFLLPLLLTSFAETNDSKYIIDDFSTSTNSYQY